MGGRMWPAAVLSSRLGRPCRATLCPGHHWVPAQLAPPETAECGHLFLSMQHHALCGVFSGDKTIPEPRNSGRDAGLARQSKHRNGTGALVEGRKLLNG